MSNSIIVRKTEEFARNIALLDPYIKADSFKDDIRPYLTNLAAANPSLEALHFVEFIQKAALTGADPRRNQVYLVPRKSNAKYKDPQTNQWMDNWITIATTVFAYQFFIAKAQSQGDYKGYERTTGKGLYYNPYSNKETETLYCDVRALREGMNLPPYRAWLPEFVQMKDNNPNATWLRAPHLMLEKCAIANAFRLAWPEAMSGMYISEEMTGEPSKETAPDPEPKVHVVNFKVKNPDAPPAPAPVAPVMETDGPPLDDGPLDGSDEPADQLAESQAAHSPEPQPQPVSNPRPTPVAAAVAAPVQNATSTNQSTIQPAGDPNQGTGPMILSGTKRALWVNISQAAAQGKMNLDFVMAKLNRTTLTEKLGQELCLAISRGNIDWFKTE